MIRKIFNYWKEYLIIVISLLIIRFLFFEVHPQNIVVSEVSSGEIIKKAVDIAGYLQFKSEQYQILPDIKTNAGLIAEYQKKYGVHEGNKLVEQNEIPHVWEITWMKRNSMSFGSSQGEMENLRDFIGRLNLTFDLQGNLIGLKHGISDTSRIMPLSEEDAGKLVKDFSSKYLKNIDIDSFVITRRRPDFEKDRQSLDFKMNKPPKGNREEARIDFTYTAKYFDPSSKTDKKIDVSVTGNKISFIKLVDTKIERVPFEHTGSIHTLINIGIVIATIILIIVLLFRRFRAFELGFKQGIKIAVFTSLAMFISMLFSLSGQISPTFMVGIILAPVFSGIGILTVWSIAESFGREKLKDKFISTDLLLKGYWGNSRIGQAIIKGLALGFALNAFLLALYFILAKVFPIAIVSTSNDYLTNSLGAVHLFFGTISAIALLFFTYVLFTTSYLKDKIKDVLIIVLGGIVFGIMDSGFLVPEYLDIIVQSLIGMIIIRFLLKNDLLSTFIGAAAFYFVFRCQPMLFLNSPMYSLSFLMIVILFGIFILWSLYTFIVKDKVLDFGSLTPAYVARITERERLKRELEIAQEVQISFLPNENPELSEMEIDACCLPASEVGGDYYDYIQFDKNNLGVVIGDVSGKGIQASFYMTLVKGFVKAVCKQTTSPSEILNKLNYLFCENVERGNFITMIFAKIVLSEKRLIFARAGHNPAVVKHVKEGKTVFYQPNGFALGMEVSGQFPRFIEEENIVLDKGDLVIFYTDGITEAMNKNNEEFGTERLQKIIEELNSENPSEIIEKILNGVKSFIGKASQHDDMTLVVLKMN
jgi:phosphoserine phosphatase RsbU/P